MPIIRIEPADFYLTVPEKPGIYRIYSLDNKGNPKPLSRILAIDNLGILYIGKSENLKDRVRMLWRVLQPGYKASAHTFGVNYNSLKRIQKAFPLSSLAIGYELNANAKKYEKVLLENYRQLYGEVPPLNGSK